MATNNDIKDLFDRYIKIEHEIKLLQQDKKELLAEYKDKINPKSFQSALRAVKIISGVKPENKQEFDQALSVLEKKLTIEHIE